MVDQQPEKLFTAILVLFVLLIVGGFVATTGNRQDGGEGGLEEAEISARTAANEQLDAAASEMAASVLSANSHKIMAKGWPSTTPMWPTIDTEESSQSNISNPSNWFNLVEPFIYADKPRSVDYSLLLNINKTISESLKSHLRPMSVNLSFEFYFNHDPKITALPGIKIEVDRKQFKYLEPAGQTIKPRMWIKFNEQITITDLMQFDNHDWLKFSLVNRQAPSLVAIRRLKVEFSPALESQPKPLPNPETPSLPSAPAAPSSPSLYPSPPSPQSPPSGIDSNVIVNNYDQNQAQQRPGELPGVVYNQPAQEILQPTVDLPPQPDLNPINSPPAPELIPDQPLPGGPGPADYSPEPTHHAHSKSSKHKHKTTTELPAVDNNFAPVQPGVGEDQSPAASDALETTIKPVEPKKKSGGWNPWGRRRRRRSVEQQGDAQQSIVLTCYRGDQCDWVADSKEDIQWSLARMPPSTSTVQLGYYYVSNIINYGDSSKMLRLSLNQTDQATVADQNSDHCIELALHTTERTYLKLYRLKKAINDEPDSWSKGNLLMVWAPTMSSSGDQSSRGMPARSYLPKARLSAMENGLNGWTLETLCYGDFFPDPKECGAGACAFGFEMAANDAASKSSSIVDIVNKSGSSSDPYAAASSDDPSSAPNTVPAAAVANSLASEQVVGVSLLREFTTNLPLKPSRPKWLETWQREEVEPGDSWKFYPRLDYLINSDNISLVNLYDDSHYFIASDWLNVNSNLDLVANFEIDLLAPNTTNLTTLLDPQTYLTSNSIKLFGDQQFVSTPLESVLFTLKTITRLVDSSFNTIYATNSSIEWHLGDNSSVFNLSLAASEHLNLAATTPPGTDGNLFKVILEFILDCHWLNGNRQGELDRFLASNGLVYQLSLVNVSLSDRCFPNPCQFGSCHQNGTGFEDWNCQCDDRHRGRHCEFGRWCNIAHVTPWIPSAQQSLAGGKQQQSIGAKSAPNQPVRQPKLAIETVTRVTGKDYCQRKLGLGFKCTDIDLALNENLYTEEEKTFTCSCQDDFYLSDDSKCKQAHLCNSIMCPSIGMTCDDTKPFNRTQPCHCNEKQDWFPDPHNPNKCIRHQCHNKTKDCGFEAHICLPTLPGEKPICKCGPKFTLKEDSKGQKYCQSMACVLPTLNDCKQVCLPDNSNPQKPYRCGCHPGFTLDSADGVSCRPNKGNAPPKCKPACRDETQICTELGCRCKQGFIGEGEVVVQQTLDKSRHSAGSSNRTVVDYVQSVRCLNICSLTYAENKEEFEMVESICPLGLCDPSTFQCRCSDSSSAALINTKYESNSANQSSPSSGNKKVNDDKAQITALCHLRRVCDKDSTYYNLCNSRGAICVPDYTKPAMFDCICPPSTEKRYYGEGNSNEFKCEPKCNSRKNVAECLGRNAICKQVDKDEVRCDCLPGLMFQHDHKCYLAKYSYALNLIIVNRYYEPESKFHRFQSINSTISVKEDSKSSEDHGEDTTTLLEHKDEGQTDSEQEHSDSNPDLESDPHFNEIRPQYLRSHKQNFKSIFITDYNRCNITQVIPKLVLEDRYEHDIESFLSYIEQCNEKIHQNARTYHLNSKLSEDLRQSLRQHLRDFTVTTNNSSCIETDTSGMFLDCTIYLQSNEPILESTVDNVFNECDKHGQDNNFCWIKPRLLLKRPTSAASTVHSAGRHLHRKHHQLAVDHEVENPLNNATVLKHNLNFRQIIPCEMSNFCGPDSYSVRLDDQTSLCSCKCSDNIEVIDVKELEPRKHSEFDDGSKFAIKEICAPKNHCEANSTFCLWKTGSTCQFDVKSGSHCPCVYPSYEAAGRCVEVTFDQMKNTLIIIIILLGTAFLVSFSINFIALTRSKSIFGRSKQYPLNEFPPSRPHNRSTGVPNPAFTND